MAIIRHADGMTPPITPTRPRRRWLPAGILAVLLIVGAWLALLAVTRPDQHTTSSAATTPAKTALRAAYETCGNVGELADADRTLFLDMEGEDVDSGTLTTDDLACVLAALHTPSYVVHQMDQTRALDGRQSDSWGTFEASWSYHPDNGLDILIRERE